MPINYKDGKIYKITSYKTDQIYIGSTTMTLSQRMYKHHQDLKQYINGTKKQISTSIELLKFDDAKIYLIENYPCNTREELCSREGYYINKMECVNKINPTPWSNEKKKSFHKQYYQDNKDELSAKHKKYVEINKEEISEYHKDYYEKNREKLLARAKVNSEKNKDKICERRRNNKANIKVYNKEYSELNKDKIRERSKLNREKNKDKRSEKNKEKINCECGCEITRGYIAEHLKSQKHLKLIKINSNN